MAQTKWFSLHARSNAQGQTKWVFITSDGMLQGPVHNTHQEAMKWFEKEFGVPQFTSEPTPTPNLNEAGLPKKRRAKSETLLTIDPGE